MCPKLLKLSVINLGCIGPEGIKVALDNVVCLVDPVGLKLRFWPTQRTLWEHGLRV